MGAGATRIGRDNWVRVKMLKTVGSFAMGEYTTVPKELADAWVREGSAVLVDWRGHAVTK